MGIIFNKCCELWMNEFLAMLVKHKETEKLLKEAYEHLEYCGYGDSWERECAKEAKLQERLNKYFGE
jgi:hypothetical protein